MDIEKLKKIGYNKKDIRSIKNEFRLYTEYIWEIKEEMNLQQDDHMIRREEFQDIFEKDPTIFTKSELEEIKKTDQFILDHIQEAAKWFHFSHDYKNHPKKHWWNYAKFIANGEIEKPNLDEIYKPYFEKIKSS